ncbi:unnamed protein product, partial [Effrenium voratum]
LVPNCRSLAWRSPNGVPRRPRSRSSCRLRRRSGSVSSVTGAAPSQERLRHRSSCRLRH